MPNDINILKEYKKVLEKIAYDKSNRLDNIDLEDTPLLLINKYGNVYYVNYSPDDVKHINTYKRLINKYDDSYMKDVRKIVENHKVGTTGFDISKEVAYLTESIVFFHTDVHNKEINVKEASLIFPFDTIDVELEKLTDILKNIKDNNFKVHLGFTFRKKPKGKIGYLRLGMLNNNTCNDSNVKRK